MTDPTTPKRPRKRRNSRRDDAIRQEYARWKAAAHTLEACSQAALARKYGVTRARIQQIIKEFPPESAP